MAWQAICRGANGIVFYSFFDIKRNDDVPFAKQWTVLSAVAEEIDSYAPVLLSDEGAAPPVTITTTCTTTGGQDLVARPNSGVAGGPPSWLSARARWAAPAGGTAATAAGNTYYLFVANDGNGAGGVTFTLSNTVGSIGAGGVEVVSESPPRKIKPPQGGRSFSDAIDALAVVVYRFSPTGA
eukprot:SAG22_NODE_913_length_6527_cov_2.919726_6_plen_182_part_00